MTNRHTTFYVKDIKPIEFCGKPVMWQMDLNGAFEKPFETQPTKGEHDFNTCEGCQSALKELIKRLTEKFEGNHKEGKKPFPLCCSAHSELLKLDEFKMSDFVRVPEMVAKKIIYTNSHIKNHQKNETYYKDITDYIDYTIDSFGQMPSNAERLYLSDYFSYVTDLLEGNTEITKERKKTLLEYLNTYQTPTESPKTDLNILLDTYQKWLKIFPFEISFFANLKPQFEKQLPILNGKPEVNKYTGLAKFKMHTKGSLIDVLHLLTLNLLDKINVPELRKQGLITDLQAKQLEFSDAELQTKTAEITRKFSKGELKYINALKKWLQVHKEYFKEVTPLVKDLPPQQAETSKPDENKKDLHPQIFKGNAFEVFEKYHSTKDLAENSKTDLSLLFQLFTNDNLFVDTIELKHYIKWLNKTYNYQLTELKKVNIKSKPNIQRTNDYKEYKNTTLKQP